MLLTKFSLLLSVGQAVKILRAPASPHVDTSLTTTVNGTLTSFTITPGTGCPAGSYYTPPIEPGKTLNTYIDFNSSLFLYNSTTSTAPVTCNLSMTYEFVYPEDGQAQLSIDTSTLADAQFEAGDAYRTTYFEAVYDLSLITQGEDDFNATMSYSRTKDEGPQPFDVSAWVSPIGTPGEKGVGTFQWGLSIDVGNGPGQFSVSRIDIGFGLFPPHVDPPEEE